MGEEKCGDASPAFLLRAMELRRCRTPLPIAKIWCARATRTAGSPRWRRCSRPWADTASRPKPQALVDLIEARAFDLYADPMPSLDAFAAYGRRTASGLIELAARVLDPDHADVGELAAPAGIAYATAGLIAVA
jgi:phytoene/squalene synthetase